MNLVKVCPTCGYSNSVVSLFCIGSGCGVSLVGVDPTEQSSSQQGQEPLPDINFASIRCPECSAEITQVTQRCIYCDAVLPRGDSQEEPSVRVELRWPWGTQNLTGTLMIGRDSPAPAELVKAILDRGYDNVSRSHAELTVSDENVSVKDLGSVNGTYIDGVRIPPNKAIPLKHGSVIRFAANLAVEISIKQFC